ncbi:haloacid dehalogenase superfamily, subfamily IA, variant 3 with third motif having DD or ED/beta-phosphoglucomutase family hydrolase [Cnuella takakiae]|uniref:Beta-phosphoglucomutase n=1 Tax=Cnuella takakiae TaxID=1302690 RepID=A0A1M5AZQ9_9BACT|nr:HAD family phosphatase [Cnuella takakiae]OLY93286.1 haloacid dehalogenase [Cnuella takakiae]SHF35791.1 haloacid dehalogenase superfamily, subfamily IA, variant 3 with third motif having DD or ED/beta-phosphoglucomutase family hydrolase [Cnuella takakiae]
MNNTFKAFLFDLNGTMIDDMEYHTQAWYQVLTGQLGASLDYAEVKKEMYGKNAEVLLRIFGPNRFSPEEIEYLSVEKEKQYQAAFKPHLKLIEGLDAFLEQAHQAGIKMAICSAAITANIDFVIDGLGIRHYFGAIVSADDVTTSKPHPETFLKGAELLGMAPEACIVFEDAPKGVEAAANAGMNAVVLTTMHAREEFAAYTNSICFAPNYNDPALRTIFFKMPQTFNR